MWFSERALLFVDARSAAVAVYRGKGARASLVRFASSEIASSAGSAAIGDTLEGARETVTRLLRDTKAPTRGAALALPIGATFPSVLDEPLVKESGAPVDAVEIAKFRVAPLLPFPIAQAEVRIELSTGPRGPAVVQAVPRSAIETAERFMESLGFRNSVVTSTLSAALRGLSAESSVADLVLGDVAFALITRNSLGSVDAVHLRLLAPGDDRAQRATSEALRAASPKAIRVVGEDARVMQDRSPETPVRAAFDSRVLALAPDAYRFPFLGVFRGVGA